MRLDEALDGVIRLGVDTSPIICFVEAHPQYDAVVSSIFQRIDSGKLMGVTSVITLTEVLVQPILHRNSSLHNQYRTLLIRSRNFQTLPIDYEVAEMAAGLRSRYRLRTPDAI